MLTTARKYIHSQSNIDQTTGYHCLAKLSQSTHFQLGIHTHLLEPHLIPNKDNKATFPPNRIEPNWHIKLTIMPPFPKVLLFQSLAQPYHLPFHKYGFLFFSTSISFFFYVFFSAWKPPYVFYCLPYLPFRTQNIEFLAYYKPDHVFPQQWC